MTARFYSAAAQPQVMTELPDGTYGLVQGQSATKAHVAALQQLKKGMLQADDPQAGQMQLVLGGGHVMDQVKETQADFIACPVNLSGAQAAMNSRVATQKVQGRLPQAVFIMPDFFMETPRFETAQSALGVLVDLIEAYGALDHGHPIGDPLIWSGLEAFSQGFLRALDGDAQGHRALIHAALMSGVGTAYKGFGGAHTAAMALRDQTPQSYGCIKASIAAEIIDLHCQSLSEHLPDHPALERYAMVGELLAERPFEAREEAFASLVGTLRRWVSRLDIPKITTDHHGIEQASASLQTPPHWQATDLGR